MSSSLRAFLIMLNVCIPLASLDGQEKFDQKQFAAWFSAIDIKTKGGDTHFTLNQSLKHDIELFDNGSSKPTSLGKFSEAFELVCPNSPRWIIESIRKAKIVSEMTLTVQLPHLDRVSADKFFTFDRQFKRSTSERQLLGKVLAGIFPLDFEPLGRERFISCAYSPESKLICRFVFTEDEASSYVVGCDLSGIRWIQRCWSSVELASSGPLPRNVGAMWAENDIAMLAVLSERSISIEGYQFDSGDVVVRLNSDLSWGKSP